MIDQFRWCLLGSGVLALWASSVVSLIGNATCGMICFEPLNDRLLATTKALRFSHHLSCDLFRTRTASTQTCDDLIKACGCRFSCRPIYNSYAASKLSYVQALSDHKRWCLITVAAALDVPLKFINNNHRTDNSNIVVYCIRNKKNRYLSTTFTPPLAPSSTKLSANCFDVEMETYTELTNGTALLLQRSQKESS